MTEKQPFGRPSTIGGTIYLAVLAVAVVGLVLVAGNDWRLGVIVLGGALLFAALARMVLSDFESGMLRVRNKAFDVLALSGLGALMIVLALIIPNQPG